MDETALPPLPDDERRPKPLDWVITLAMLGLGLLGLFLVHDLADPEDRGRLQPWANYLALLLLVAPVLVRRMFPVAVCIWVGVGFAVFRVLEVPEGPVSSLAVFVCIHAAGAHVADPDRRNLARGLALLAGFVAVAYSLGREIEAVGFDTVVGATLTVGINLAFYVAAWLLGDRDRQQRIDRAELARRADQLAEERERTARQAVIDERVRIARELHDVVAHHVSVMGVQAAAARHVLDRDADSASSALEHVEASGRQAVEELQRLVGVLREDAADGVDAPQPTLEALPQLVESMRGAGLEVEVRTIGRPRPMPSSVGLSAYRIVQEALTNVVRHAPGACTTVVLSHVADALQVEVVNGPPPADATPSAPGGGRGLLGMRERVLMLGGSLRHGSLPRGGFRVVATLPLAGGNELVGSEALT